MPARIASGSVGHASTTAANSGSAEVVGVGGSAGTGQQPAHGVGFFSVGQRKSCNHGQRFGEPIIQAGRIGPRYTGYGVAIVGVGGAPNRSIFARICTDCTGFRTASDFGNS
ncbi:MAG: hypothetical protein HOP29_16770 [Phycisphaerales bacterium]|nr:hypothetical protein [Phycisphaerales bacterium]